MKNNYVRTAITVFLTASLLIIVMAFISSSAYAGIYSSSIEEGNEEKLRWDPPYDPNAVTYLEIKPSKTGVITFTADYSCYVSLCDAKRNVLSTSGNNSAGDPLEPNNTNAFMRRVFYGVKGGVTYNLRIVNMPTRQEGGDYVGVFLYTTSKVSPAKCGSSKKKAKAIKKKKTVKGLFTAGNRKAQWFKITNKQKKTKIYISADKINYILNIKAYYKKGKKWKAVDDVVSWQTDYKKTYFVGKINKKVKHTYYLKITPRGKTSGSYTIKWK